MEEVNKIEEKGGIWRCGAWEETYPDRLRCYEGMPGMLYTKGCLPQEEKKTVAIVGARACSAYGAHQPIPLPKSWQSMGYRLSVVWQEELMEKPTRVLWMVEEKPLQLWGAGWIFAILRNMQS